MIFRVFAKVFVQPKYLALAAGTSIIVFVLATWLPNLRLIATIIGSTNTSLSEKVGVPVSLTGSIATNFTTLAAVYTVLIAFLFGMYLALFVYYFQKKRAGAQRGEVAIGFFGLASGILGIGCAACGSVLLTGTLALFGTATALTFLPLGGAEFGILGTVLLALAVYVTAKQIANPNVCPAGLTIIN